MKQDLGLVAQRVRGHVVEMIGKARSGHPGGSLSATDILTFLYFQKMNIDPQNPHWEKRDRFVLSKGHAAPALYAVLAERGFFPTEELLGLRQFGSRLQGHPDCLKTPGVDASTGSLGQGLSIANGLALAARLNGEFVSGAVDKDGKVQPSQRVYGDTVDVLDELGIEPVVGLGDPGKMDCRDEAEKGAPLTTKAIRTILEASGENVAEERRNWQVTGEVKLKGREGERS